jgi:hypothetical protein
MKRYCFVLDSGHRDWVIALDFRGACLAWERFGHDPRTIMAMECFG